jgi:hypothetical protein
MNRTLVTPKSPRSLYIIPILLWLLEWFYLLDPYFEAMNKQGAYSDGSSGMLLGMGQIAAIPLLPVIGLILFLILRNYPGSISLWVWNHQKQWLSLFWTALFLIPTLISIAETYRMVSLRLPLNICAELIHIYLYLCFRAVLVRKTDTTSRTKISANSVDYLICPKCQLEQWQGYSSCQKCETPLS